MNYYNISGLNGCLTLIFIGIIFTFLLRVFTGFIIATLPFWLVLGMLLVFRNLYKSYSAFRKPNVTVEDDYSSRGGDVFEESASFADGEISREAEDVEFVAYDDTDDE